MTCLSANQKCCSHSLKGWEFRRRAEERAMTCYACLREALAHIRWILLQR